MKKTNLSNALAVVAVTFIVAGCLHDDDKDVDINILNGTWVGVEQDVNNGGSGGINIITFKMLSGKITEVTREDQGAASELVNQNLVGTVSAKTKNIFSYDLGDATNTLGGLYGDTTTSHFAFLDDKFRFGVMQKIAVEVAPEDVYTNLVYLDNDIAGSWSGFSVNVRNGTMSAINNFNSQVVVDQDALTFAGTDNAASVTGGRFESIQTLSISNMMKGVYTGTWENPDDNTKFGDITAILSSDKTFLSARLCLSFNLLPGNGVPDSQMCTFASWNK